MTEAAAEERFEQAAQLRDAIRTIETLRTRQQKMASPEFGDRDAFGLKLGPAGAVVQVFQMRRGRVVERIELVTDPGVLGSSTRSIRREDSGGGVADAPPDAGLPGLTECDVLQAAVQQFYAEHAARRRSTCRCRFRRPTPSCSKNWLSERSERRVRIMVPRRGEKRGLLDLAARNAEVAYQARFNENVAANYDALETLRAVLALPSLPRRIECFDISTIQGSETVASMVVCEDGRMKKAEYRKFRIRGTRARGLAGSRVRMGYSRPCRGPNTGVGEVAEAQRCQHPRATLPRRRTASRRAANRRFLDDFASMHEVVSRRYRKLLENGGPFPDLILIDGGKGQLSAAYEALEDLGLGNAGGGRHRQEGGAAVHPRSRGPDRAARGQPGAAADPAHPRRGAPVRRDVPPRLADQARPAVRARRDRRDRAAPAQGAADGLRHRWPASGGRPARSWCGSSARSPPTPCWRISPLRA